MGLPLQSLPLVGRSVNNMLVLLVQLLVLLLLWSNKTEGRRSQCR